MKNERERERDTRAGEERVSGRQRKQEKRKETQRTRRGSILLICIQISKVSRAQSENNRVARDFLSLHREEEITARRCLDIKEGKEIVVDLREKGRGRGGKREHQEQQKRMNRNESKFE